MIESTPVNGRKKPLNNGRECETCVFYKEADLSQIPKGRDEKILQKNFSTCTRHANRLCRSVIIRGCGIRRNHYQPKGQSL